MISIDVGLGGTVSGALEVEVIITPVIPPASADLVAGQSLSDTPNWSTFSNTANYTTNNPGQTILEVVVNYIGDTPDATTPLQDGQRNTFSITVIDTGGAHTTFPVQERIAVYPAPVAAGSVSDQTYGLNTPISTLDITGDFSGNAISYALAPSSAPLPEGLTLSANGQITGTPTTPTAQAALVVRGTNSGGFADTAFEISVLAIAARVINSVTAGMFADGGLPIVLNSATATVGDVAHWVLYPAAENAPTATQVAAGQQQNGSAASDSGSGVWPGPFGRTLVDGIPLGAYKLAVVIDNGLLSNVAESTAFDVDTQAPNLSSPVLAEGGGNITWGVTSDTTVQGMIYAALRQSSASVLTASDIINGTGNAVDTNTDATPAADSSNGGTFAAPVAGTYVADMVHVDGYANTSAVVSSNVATIGASPGLLRGATTRLLDQTSIKTTFTSGVDGGVDVTPAAGSDRMLTFVVYWTNRGTPPAGAPALTFGGVSAIEVANYIGGGFAPSVAIYRIAEASIPAGASSTSFASTTDIYRVSCHLIEYTGANQSTPFGPAVTSNINSTSIPVSLNVINPSSLMLSGAYWRGSGGTAPVAPTTDSGGTVIEIVERSIAGNDVNGVGSIAQEAVGAPGNVTHVFTGSASSPMVIFAVELIEA